MLRFFLAIFLFATPAWAEEVVLGLSQDQVAITATFDGSEILIFGAVKREEAIPEGPLDVIVTISGPSEPVLVQRKDKRFGIWVNTDFVEVDAAPSFYAVATTRQLEEILSEVEDLRRQISIDRAIRSVGAPMEITDSENFTEALIRIRSRDDLYQQLDGQVDLTQATLFNTSIALPANLTEGDYNARIFLVRDGAVVSQYQTDIDVRKVGLERLLYTLAHQQPLVYGLLSLFIAIAAGWGASAAFRLVKS